jgi:putative phosphoribosyl transferase
MRFKNREHAASLLAARLSAYKGANPLILGVPRGGVPMARIIADALGGDVDVVLVRKLRAAFQPELAIGAIDESSVILKGRHMDLREVSDPYLREEIRTQGEILRTRSELYRRAHGPVDVSGRIAIIVDDGVATGCSMLAAIRSVRTKDPRKVVVAVAVAPPETFALIREEADETICLQPPQYFFAVGQAFEDFSEVTDEMVVAALAGRAHKQEPAHSKSGA